MTCQSGILSDFFCSRTSPDISEISLLIWRHMKADFPESVYRRGVLTVAGIPLLVVNDRTRAPIEQKGIYLQIILIVLLYGAIVCREFSAVGTSVLQVIQLRCLALEYCAFLQVTLILLLVLRLIA